MLDNELDMFELEDDVDWGVVILVSDGVLLRDLLLIGEWGIVNDFVLALNVEFSLVVCALCSPEVQPMCVGS